MSQPDLHQALRPRLRGLIHLGAIPLALLAAWYLAGIAEGTDGQRLAVTIFGVTLVGLFSVSSLYHVPSWSTRATRVLVRIDMAMIMLFIAGSFTPFAMYLLEGSWRFWSVAAAWVVAIVGGGFAASRITAPRWFTGFWYLAYGWGLGIAMYQMISRLSVPAIALVLIGAICYSLGSIVYVSRRPDPWPEWYGFHEVFHSLVVIGGTAHYVALWRYVVT